MTITEDNRCTSVVSLTKIRKYKEHTRWDCARIFRLGFLVGIGWDAKRIATDPMILRTANNVGHQVQRLGGRFRDISMGIVLWQRTTDFYDVEASKRGLTREKLIQVLLEEIAADKTLFDNIMDDGDRF